MYYKCSSIIFNFLNMIINVRKIILAELDISDAITKYVCIHNNLETLLHELSIIDAPKEYFDDNNIIGCDILSLNKESKYLTYIYVKFYDWLQDSIIFHSYQKHLGEQKHILCDILTRYINDFDDNTVINNIIIPELNKLNIDKEEALFTFDILFKNNYVSERDILKTILNKK